MDRRTVLSMVEDLAPTRLAASWDRVGLQVGHDGGAVTGILVAVNASHAAAARAISQGHNLLITHHPILFKPLEALRTDRDPGRTIALLASHDVAAYAAHTNLDATACNRRLCDLLGWEFGEVLEEGGVEPNYLVSVFVSAPEAESVTRALWEAGAGRRDPASAWYPGEATFRSTPSPGAIPRIATVQGTRVEVVVGKGDLGNVLDALEKVVPADRSLPEVVEMRSSGQRWGIGLVGDLSAPRTIADIASQVARTLTPRSLRLVGERDAIVRRVAICSGSGGSLAHLARDRGADLYITGELGYHTALEVRERGLHVLETGHQASEEPVVDFLVGYLRGLLPTTIPVEAFHELEPFEPLTF